MDLPYRLVDVFADRALTGNQLAVFPEAAGLDDATMQRLAQETNLSETTFVTGHADDGTPQVRIFTPAAELPFAGHPTLGTAHVTEAEALDLRVGRIPVRPDADGRLWMTQNEVTFGPALDPGMVGDALGVDPLAAEVASAGTPVALVQVADGDAVRAAALDVARFALPTPGLAGVYVFALDNGHGTDVHARFFAEFVGIKEDAATGGAAGPLAAWLAREDHLPTGTTLTVAQGEEMGRHSRIHLRFQDGRPVVGGRVVDVAEGIFHLET